MCVSYWYNKKSSYNLNNPSENDFAQIIWASSTKVGLGLKTFKTNTRMVYVCVAHFTPTGNTGSFQDNVKFASVTTPIPIIDIPIPADCLEIFRSTALAKVNSYRASHGTAPLQRVTALDDLAQGLSRAAAMQKPSGIKLNANVTGSSDYLKYCPNAVYPTDVTWCKSMIEFHFFCIDIISKKLFS